MVMKSYQSGSIPRPLRELRLLSVRFIRHNETDFFYFYDSPWYFNDHSSCLKRSWARHHTSGSQSGGTRLNAIKVQGCREFLLQRHCLVNRYLSWHDVITSLLAVLFQSLNLVPSGYVRYGDFTPITRYLIRRMCAITFIKIDVIWNGLYDYIIFILVSFRVATIENWKLIS